MHISNVDVQHLYLRFLYTEDLVAVLEINDAPVNVKTVTRQKLARMEARARKGKS